MDKDRFSEMRGKLMSQLDNLREIEDEEIYRKIDEIILEAGQETHIRLSRRNALRNELFNSVRRLDILQDLIDDNSVTEIMVNGPDSVFIEREGRLTQWNRSFSSGSKLEDIVQQIVAKCNRIVNESTPIVDARLENGARVNIVMPPVALNGPVITIRRFPDKPITIGQLIRWGAVSAEAVEFLKKLVKSGYNIFISGGTGSGKTTFMNALSSFIPSDERIITIEDNAELQIQGVKNLVRMEARNANSEGGMAVTIRDLIKSSLRMRPDRILIGEVRGSEVIDLLQALNTGHDGSISTGHANSPEDMLLRLETMVLMGMELPLPAVRRQIASGIDIIVHLGRLRDKSRKVLGIIEILGYDNAAQDIATQVLYEFEEEGTDECGIIQGGLKKRAELRDTQKLRRAGYQK